MKLSSARELKTLVVQNLAAPATIANVRSFGIMAFEARRVDSLATAPTFALGVSPTSDKPGDYRLAVRLQRRSAVGAVKALGIAEKAKGEVDIRYVGRIHKRTWFMDRHRPLQLGISIGHFNVTAGTLGAFVGGPRGSTRILSNNHVLADENQGVRGDDILQPGMFDGGLRPEDRVGGLDTFVKLRTGTAVNTVDCALAKVDDGIDSLTDKLYRARGLLGGVVDDGSEVDRVEKWGRTTGHTRGRVTAFELDNVRVGYDLGVVRFDDQLEIDASGSTSFSDGGDSGSLIVTEGDRLAVGLLFAGSQTGGRRSLGLTYANPIGTVLAALKTQLAIVGP